MIDKPIRVPSRKSRRGIWLAEEERPRSQFSSSAAPEPIAAAGEERSLVGNKDFYNADSGLEEFQRDSNNDHSDLFSNDVRPVKRRRLSTSSSSASSSASSLSPQSSLSCSQDASVPTLQAISSSISPTLSRIRKKAHQHINGQQIGSTTSSVAPITSHDAREIGLQVVDSTFAALDVAPWLVKSLSTMAIRRPTAIQSACIPELLKGRDCIAGSKTGSGKTVAFAVPILQLWAEDPFGTFAVILTPTRFANSFACVRILLDEITEGWPLAG
jgi:hypothetical protein